MSNCEHPGEYVAGNLKLCTTAGCPSERLSSQRARAAAPLTVKTLAFHGTAPPPYLDWDHDSALILGKDLLPGEPRYWVAQGMPLSRCKVALTQLHQYEGHDDWVALIRRRP